MNVTEDILRLIRTAEDNGHKITIDGTLDIVKAYRNVCKNPEVIDKLIYLLNQFDKEKKYTSTLSARQHQILNLIGLGFKSKEIASALAISEATVSTHRKNIIKKLHISGTGQLQNFAYKYAQDKLENN